MTPTTVTPTTVTVRYWAGARDAAGTPEEEVAAGGSVTELLDRLLAAHPALSDVLPVCSVLVDGLAAERTLVVPAGATVEVLPPFAGG